MPFEAADEAVAASAAHAGWPPLLLIPPPAAAAYLGLGWFQALKERLSGGAEVAVDCGADPALAHEALRQGFGHVVFTGDEIFAAELADFTERQGAVLYRTRP